MKNCMLALIATSVLSHATAFAAENNERALIAFMKVKAGTEQEFLKQAQAVIKESRKETGNIRYQLHQSAKDPQQFVFYEFFKNHEALETHKNAIHTKTFIKNTAPITLEFTLEEFVPQGSVQ